VIRDFLALTDWRVYARVVLENSAASTAWSTRTFRSQTKAWHIVIEIKAFGINHAEMRARRGPKPRR
jgi:hypothetical protein